jgi:hypothetical protein
MINGTAETETKAPTQQVAPNNELLPCPYCDRTPELSQKGKQHNNLYKNTEAFKYGCPNGHLTTNWWLFERQASQRWNKRCVMVGGIIDRARAVPLPLMAR